MAKSLKWSAEAVDDIERIADFIAQDSPFYAMAVVDKIILTTESIPANPKIGRIVPEINNKQFRERLVHKFRIIYKLDANFITVLAVIHGHQNLGCQLPRIIAP